MSIRMSGPVFGALKRMFLHGVNEKSSISATAKFEGQSAAFEKIIFTVTNNKVAGFVVTQDQTPNSHPPFRFLGSPLLWRPWTGRRSPLTRRSGSLACGCAVFLLWTDVSAGAGESERAK